MKRLKKLSVCGATGWEVWEVSKEELALLGKPDVYGYTDLDRCRVYLVAKMPPALKLDTLIHELQHAWFAVSGLGHWCEEAARVAEFEEKFIRFHTPAMIATLRSAGLLKEPK